MSCLKDQPDYHRANVARSSKGGAQATVSNGSAGSYNVQAPKWRKVLYDSNSKFADNYTPHAYFLDAIERNKNLHKYSFNECLRGSCQVAIQLNLVLLFYVSFFAIKQGQVTSYQLLSLVAALCLGCYAFLFLLTAVPPSVPPSGIGGGGGGLPRSVKRVMIFVAFGLGLSPLLHRLTDTIATDTIYTTSACSLLVHLGFHNFGLQCGTGDGINALSLNAGLFAAVCLASRLPTSLDGFVLLSFSVEVFALLPMTRQTIVGTRTNVLLTLCLSCAVLAACNWVLSSVVAWISAATLFATVVLCPMLFVHWQTYKDTIHGPWDEAVPRFDQKRRRCPTHNSQRQKVGALSQSPMAHKSR